MKKFLLSLGAAATIASTMFMASAPTASADPYRYGRGGYNGGGYNRGYRRGYNRGYRRGGFDGGDALAAGAIGLGVGAVLGSSLASRPYADDRFYGPGYYGNGYYGGGYYGRPDVVLEGPVYRERRYRPVYRERSYGYDRTAACAARYRTYDARSNTFIGYDGNAHKCRL